MILGTIRENRERCGSQSLRQENNLKFPEKSFLTCRQSMKKAITLLKFFYLQHVVKYFLKWL